MRFREIVAGMPGTYARVRKLVPQSWKPRVMSRTILGPLMSSFLAYQSGTLECWAPELFTITKAEPEKRAF